MEFEHAGDFSVDVEKRTVRGLLLPWGEKSRTSISGAEPVSFDRGTVKVPRDVSVVTANRHHNRFDPVGRASAIEDTERGLVADFAIANTDQGDEFLADYKAGKLKKLSAELLYDTDPNQKDKGVNGQLTGAGFVTEGAFASAGLFAAADAPEAVEPVQPDDKDGVTETKTVVNSDGSSTVTTTTTKTETAADGTVTEIKTVSTETVAKPAEEPAEEPKEEPVGVPNTMLASKKGATEKKVGKGEFFALLAAHDKGEVQGQDMVALANMAKATGMFALSDVKYDGTGGITTGIQLPEWIGEVWDGQSFTQKYLPLFDHADLTSLQYQGFQWDVKPQGGDWAGNKSNVPSNTPKLKAVTATAQRYAMAHDIARELQDLRVFGDSNFFDMYFQAGAEDYARWADGKVFTTLSTVAESHVADNPAGLDIGPAMSAIIDGASELVGKNLVPQFAIVGTDYYKQIGKTTSKDALAYLSAAIGIKGEDGSLDGFRLVPSSDVGATDVYVGVSQALTVRELPGSPLRADALVDGEPVPARSSTRELGVELVAERCDLHGDDQRRHELDDAAEVAVRRLAY